MSTYELAVIALPWSTGITVILCMLMVVSWFME